MSKLVRNNIPEIIARDLGTFPKTHLAHDKELIWALDDKIDEEVAELRGSSTIEGAMSEIADIIEVLLTIAMRAGYTSEKIERIRLQKRAERWGFERGIILDDY